MFTGSPTCKHWKAYAVFSIKLLKVTIVAYKTAQICAKAVKRKGGRPGTVCLRDTFFIGLFIDAQSTQVLLC